MRMEQIVLTHFCFLPGNIFQVSSTMEVVNRRRNNMFGDYFLQLESRKKQVLSS